MDKQIYKDRILETENLTDELDDSSASWLLDWGVSQLDRVLEGASEASAGERVNALMAVMRKINRVVGKLSSGDYSQSHLAEDLSALHDLFALAYPPAPSGAAPSAEEPSSNNNAPSAEPPPSEKKSSSEEEGSSQEESSSQEASSSEEEAPSFMSFLGSLFGKKPSSAKHDHPPAREHKGDEEPQTSSAEPQAPPTQVDYAAQAAHLLELEPRPALEYLARDFYRS